MKDSTSASFIVGDIFRSVVEWVRAGDKPPRTQVGSVWLMIALNLFGFTALTVWLLAVLEIKFYDTFTSIVPLAFIAFVTLCPGLYGLWVTICCWRRVYGYDWFMLPEF